MDVLSPHHSRSLPLRDVGVARPHRPVPPLPDRVCSQRPGRGGSLGRLLSLLRHHPGGGSGAAILGRDHRSQSPEGGAGPAEWHAGTV